MFRSLIGFEWRYQTRQASFYVAVAALLFLSFVFVSTGYGPKNLHVNSPYTVMQSLGLLSLASIFVLSLSCANAALRDSEHRMEELVHATALGRWTWLSTRFLGALLAALTVFAIAALGLMLAPWLVAVEPERLGAMEVPRYLWALAVMVLPNLVFVASLLFALSALTRSALASHVGAVFLYALYFVGSLLGDSPMMAGAATQTPEAMARAAVLDPFGLSAFFAQTRYWSEGDRNTRLLALEGTFLLNRLLWLGVSAGVLGWVYRRFAFRVPPGAKTGRDTAEAPVPSGAAVYRPVPCGAGVGAALRSTVGLELRYVLRSGPFGALMALWVLVMGMEVGAGATRTEYGTRLWPTTGLMLEAIQQPLSLFGTLMLIYFGAELVWRERLTGMDRVLDATPVSSAVFYGAKLVALVGMTGVLAATAVGIAMLSQVASGYYRLEPGLYLAVFYFTGLPLVVFAVATLLLQTLSPNRYVGMLLSLLLALAVRHGESLGLEHGLLRLADGPFVRYSDLNGFGDAAMTFSALMVYRGALAGLLALVTWGLWQRGVSTLRARLAALPGQWGRGGKAGAAACLGVFGVAGGLIFHGTNVLNTYESRERRADWKAEYEKAYKQHESLAWPDVVAVKVQVDLFPEERRFRAAGTYRLENRTGKPVETVWVAVPRDVTRAEVKLAGAALDSHDARFGMYGFRMEPPLAPGAQAELAFEVEVARRGLRTGELDASIVENGSFILNLDAFPLLGYRKGYELKDPAERRERGLPELPPEDGDALDVAGGPGLAWTTLDSTVSTSADQLAVAPGALRGEWREGGRRYFRYVMDRPMRNAFAYVSARYAVEKVRHGGVDVEVYFHPGHGEHVRRMLDAATRSLDLFGEQFGPYPHGQLRMVEVPSYWGFGAFALSGMLYFPEHRSFLADLRAPEGVDLVTRRVAHEVAHQWWGYQVSPAPGPGDTMIVESLAKYSEQLVLRAMYGDAHVHRVLAFDLDRYLRGRTAERGGEPPLTEARHQPYLYYGKGAVVMNALRDLLGEAAVNRALRRLVRERAHPNAPPTARDLVAALRAEASEAHHALIDQWTREAVLYDLRVETAVSEALPDGRYRVTARLASAKTARRDGRDVPLDVDEEVDVAVFAQHPAGAEPPLYAAKHRLSRGVTEVSVVVDGLPGYVGVDPFLHRIELERSDNLLKVEEARRTVAAE